MSHPLRGIYILCQCDITSQPPSGAYYILCLGPCSTYHILCQCDQVSHPPSGGTMGSGTTSSGLAPLGILYLDFHFDDSSTTPPRMSMWHIVAPPSGVLHLVPRSAVHLLHLVAVDNSPPFGGYYI